VFVLKTTATRVAALPNHCQTCGISQWRGRPLSLELHHVNGNSEDNSLANVELLCPNCHSQTDSWGGRNRRPALRLIRGGRERRPGEGPTSQRRAGSLRTLRAPTPPGGDAA
jgi:hypothetical protein